MKVTPSGGTESPSKVWVTNEDGTILAIKDSMVNIDLDELWGNPSKLTAHAAATPGTCAPSCTRKL